MSSKYGRARRDFLHPPTPTPTPARPTGSSTGSTPVETLSGRDPVGGRRNSPGAIRQNACPESRRCPAPTGTGRTYPAAPRRKSKTGHSLSTTSACRPTGKKSPGTARPRSAPCSNRTQRRSCGAPAAPPERRNKSPREPRCRARPMDSPVRRKNRETAASPDRAADFWAPPDAPGAKRLHYFSMPAWKASASGWVQPSDLERHRGTPRHGIAMVDNSFVPAEPPPTAALRECSRAPEPWPLPARCLKGSLPEQTGAPRDAGFYRSGRIASRLLRSSSGSIYTAWQSFSRASLTRLLPVCYGARLSLPVNVSILSSIFGFICHELYIVRVALPFILVFNLGGQVFRPARSE